MADLFCCSGILGGIMVLMIVSSMIDLLCLKSQTVHSGTKKMYVLSDLHTYDNNGLTDITENEIEDKNKTFNANGVAVITSNGLTKNNPKTSNGRQHETSIDSDLTENILDTTQPEAEESMLLILSLSFER